MFHVRRGATLVGVCMLLMVVVGLAFVVDRGLKASWADDTLAKLTLEEKVGQLFMVSIAATPPPQAAMLYCWDPNIDREAYCQHLIRDCHIGGLIMFYGDPEKQVALINRMQNSSKIPLLIGQDCEWGLSMRLHDTIQFPKNMTLGALQDETLIYKVGQEIGRQCKAVGVHINFAPVIDINTNRANPIIGTRSFGISKEGVARKGLLFAKGLQSVGILACAKHFPGHGDTSVDSHLDLPVINHSRERLMSEEIYPFKKLIAGGVDAIMPAHIAIEALGSPKMSAILSRPVVTELLRKELEFSGLIITDGMGMKGVAKFLLPHESSLRAVQAGNDIILCPLDVERSIEHIVEAVKNGGLDRNELDEHVLRILKAKEKLGLNMNRITDTKNVTKLIKNSSAYDLKKLLYTKAVTVINNTSNVLPLSSDTDLAIVDIGQQQDRDATAFYLPLDADKAQIADILDDLQDTSTVVVRIFQLAQNQGKYGKVTELAPAVELFLKALHKNGKEVIQILCTTPYGIYLLPKTPAIVAYENDPDALAAAMDVLWGRSVAEGNLPISLN